VLGIPDEKFKTLLSDAQKRRDSLRQALAARTPRSDTVKVDTIAKKPASAGETYTMQNGREIQLPPGVTAKQVEAIFAKFRTREPRTPAEDEIMNKLRQSGAFGGMGGGGGGMGGGMGGRGGAGGFGGGRQRGGSDFQFGGDYIVFTMKDGQPIPVYIRTGLTDLDYSEVVSGLSPTDSVLVLPSASLVQSQTEAKTRAAQFTGGVVPGGGTTNRPATGAPAGGGGGRPPGGGAR